jgi:hypothetical protein
VLTILSSTSNTGPAFEMKLTDGNKIHGVIGDGSTILAANADAAFKYTAGVWCHIAYVVTPSGYAIYANGDSVGGEGLPGSALLYDATHSINIGSLKAASEFFNGSIDEIRIYNTALTKTNIQADLHNVIVSVPANLTLYYNFDQPTGSTTLTDNSANNFTGAIAGTTPYNFVESYAMVTPYKGAASNITGTSFTANWKAPATGITENYLLDVSADANFATFVPGYNQLSVSGLSQNVTGLTAGKKYYYRVKSNKASVAGQGAFIAKILATTAASLTANPTAAGAYNKGVAYIKAYPNPVKTTATVEFDAVTESKYEAQLLNAIGQVITAKSGLTVKGANIIVFDMNNVAAGMYHVRLLDKEHGVRIIKFAKTK